LKLERPVRKVEINLITSLNIDIDTGNSLIRITIRLGSSDDLSLIESHYVEITNSKSDRLVITPEGTVLTLSKTVTTPSGYRDLLNILSTSQMQEDIIELGIHAGWLDRAFAVVR
jgi:hypothetical protein